ISRLMCAACIPLGYTCWPSYGIGAAEISASPSTGATLVPPDPLGELNQLFLDAYTARRVAGIQATSPLIIASCSTFVWHRNGQQETIHTIPDIYHALKDVSHVPVTIHLLLSAIAKDGGALPCGWPARP